VGRKTKGRARGAGNGKTAIGTGASTEAGTGADTGETAGSVGHVAVEVDRAAILNEAAAVAAEAPPETPVPTPAGEAPSLSHEPASAPVPVVPVDVEAKAVELAPAVSLLVHRGFALTAPAWEVTQDEAASIGGPLALVLAYFVPTDKMDPKWLAVATCAVAVYNVADKRRDEKGDFLPLREKPKLATPAATPAPAASLRV